MEKEIWKPVVNFEEFYAISNLGRVKSLDRLYAVSNQYGKCKNKYRKRCGRIIKLAKCKKTGYLTFTMCKSGKRYYPTVHRLVLETFIPNPENKSCCNHKNGIKTDNNINNLEWATYSENRKHAHKIGLHKGTWFGKFGKDNPHSKKVMAISKLGKTKIYRSIREAGRITKINYSCISKACSGSQKRAGGLKWRYIDAS